MIMTKFCQTAAVLTIALFAGRRPYHCGGEAGCQPAADPGTVFHRANLWDDRRSQEARLRSGRSRRWRLRQGRQTGQRRRKSVGSKSQSRLAQSSRPDFLCRCLERCEIKPCFPWSARACPLPAPTAPFRRATVKSARRSLKVQKRCCQMVANWLHWLDLPRASGLTNAGVASRSRSPIRRYRSSLNRPVSPMRLLACRSPPTFCSGSRRFRYSMERTTLSAWAPQEPFRPTACAGKVKVLTAVLGDTTEELMKAGLHGLCGGIAGRGGWTAVRRYGGQADQGRQARSERRRHPRRSRDAEESEQHRSFDHPSAGSLIRNHGMAAEPPSHERYLNGNSIILVR